MVDYYITTKNLIKTSPLSEIGLSGIRDYRIRSSGILIINSFNLINPHPDK